MGQKVHPKSLRLGIIQTWDSNWIADPKEYAKNIAEDNKIRVFVKKQLKAASLSKIEIDRKAQKIIIRLISGRPGMIVGRGGQGLDTLRQQVVKLTGKKDIQIDVLEVARIEADAQLVAESIAQQLEKRIAFRRAMKQSVQRTMRAGVKGIKIMVSGRLGGTDIARTEWTKEGRIPLHTFRADIDYGFAEAMTVFGIIGVKVWIFKGEVMPGEVAISNVKQKVVRPDEAGEGGASGGATANQGLQGAGPRSGARRGGPGGDRPAGGGRGRGGDRPAGGRGKAGGGAPKAEAPAAETETKPEASE